MRLLFFTITFAAAGAVAPAAGQQDAVRLVNDTAASAFVVEIGPVNLPGGMAHHDGAHGAVLPPVGTVRVPSAAYLYAFSYDVVDGAGRTLPADLVHHINLIDPGHRELFLPISQRMLAVGKETGSHSLPRWLFGYPVEAGQPIVVSAMLHNPTPQDYPDATVRVRLKYVARGGLWPFFTVYPFQLDVAFPAGDKSFDLPPGRSSRSYEASPAIPGRLLAIGGHTHAYAVSLTFEDATANKIIWDGKPQLDASGGVVGVPVGRLYRRLGVKLDPTHRYRVTVTYVNPTSDTLRAGGMGVVGGVFMPAGGRAWPQADTTDRWYALDRLHYLRDVQGNLAAILADSAAAGAPKAPAEHAGHGHRH